MTDLSVRPAATAQPVAPVPRRTRRPSWLDFRLIGGVVLVLLSVLGGSAALGSADHRYPVWRLSKSLTAGSVLRASDLSVARVQLGTDRQAYVGSAEAVVGKTLQHDVSAGELLPRSELATPAPGITVTVPVASQNAPQLNRGDRITVWLTTKTCRAVVVLGGATVQDARQTGGSGFATGGGVAIVLSLSAEDAGRVISALDMDSAVLRVGVLGAGQTPPSAAADLAVCGVGAK